MNLRARRARTTTTVCSKHASVPEIYENKETVFNLRRQLSLSPATGPGRKARQLNSSVKFIYSEKATKCCEISTLLLSNVVPVKSKVEISQNFVAFSEFMNFDNQMSVIFERVFF